jgi:uncharacterized membrane protein YkvA (DUF1232 family)
MISSSMNPRKIFQFWINFKNDIRLTYFLLREARVPFYLKLPVILALFYFIIPFDLISDFFIPGIGYIDDILILSWAVRFFLKQVPDELKNEYVNR